jgi:alkylhydroperoxidase family enzyme
VTRHFSEPEIAALLVDIAQINSWNRFNVAVRMMVGQKWEQAA